MRSFYYFVIKGNTPAAIVGAILLALRFLQLGALDSNNEVLPLTFTEAYLSCNGTFVAAFALVPLLAITTLRPALKISSVNFATRLGSRRRAATRCALFSITIGTLYSAILNLTSIPVACFEAASYPDWITVFSSAVLQTVICSFIALLCFTLFYTFESGAIALMGCLLYGLWDFMAANVVGGGVPSIGWALTILSPDYSLYDFSHKLSFLGSILAVQCLITLFLFAIHDYIPRNNLTD